MRATTAVAILCAMLAACLAGVGEPGPPLAISTATSLPTVAFKGFDSTSTVFDFDGDGQLEIVAQNDNSHAYVFDSRSGALLAELATRIPAGWQARSFNVPEAAITGPDGAARLVVQNSAAVLTVFRFVPEASSATHFTFVSEWDRRLDSCNPDPGSDSKPVLADLDQDGTLEIVAATEEQGIYALRIDGTPYWKNCMGGGNAEPTVADLDLDGFPEVVYPSDAGIVTALGGRTGWTFWAYDVPANHDLDSGSIPVGAAVGQLDGWLGPDIVVGARDSHDPVDWSQDHAMLLALDSTGKLLWARQDPEGNPLTYTHPIIVDADGDGAVEVYWGDWNTNGHKPPERESDAWNVTGPGHTYRYDAAGNLVWRASLDSYWSNNDLAIADVDGDGIQDILANGPGPGGDGFWALDVRTGDPESFHGTFPWQVAGGPVVADLWGTGTMQWVVQVGPGDASVTGGGILVVDTTAPYSSAWPHAPSPSLERLRAQIPLQALEPPPATPLAEQETLQPVAEPPAEQPDAAAEDRKPAGFAADQTVPAAGALLLVGLLVFAATRKRARG